MDYLILCIYAVTSLVIGFLSVRYFLLRRYAFSRNELAGSHLGLRELRPELKREVEKEEKEFSDELIAQIIGSIKIFSYLERPVLDELITLLVKKNYQSGEVLFDFKSVDKSIYIVVEGKLQVYLQQQSIDGTDEERYHLLHEIKSGSMVSSIVDILSLITEESAIGKELLQSMNLEKRSIPTKSRKLSELKISKSGLFNVTQKATNSVLQIVVKATEETSVVVLPEKSFLMLVDKFPSAAVHIMQVILTRFQRVTMMTLFRYLGMSKELYKIEKAVYELPCENEFYTSLNVKNWDHSKCEQIDALKIEIFDCIARCIGLNVQNSSSFPSPADKDKQDFSKPLTRIERLQKAIEIKRFDLGSTLLEYGERIEGLYFVLDGILSVSSSKESNFLKDSIKNEQVELFEIGSGGMAGYLGSFIPHPSFISIKAKTEVTLGFLPKAACDKMIENHPEVLLNLAKRLVMNVSSLIRQIDFALDWIHLNAGQILYNQNDDSDSIYIVLHGRLRATLESANSTCQVIHEYGPSDSVGEFEVLANCKRPYTIHAIRDSELACVPKTLFNALALKYPEITLQISKAIAIKYQEKIAINKELDFEFAQKNMNLRTVALIPVDTQVPLMEFSTRLYDELALRSSVLLLDNEKVIDVLGKHAFSSIGKLKLLSWLSEEEEKHRIVLYMADTLNSPWTMRCIRQADCILIVGIAENNPGIGDFEKLLFGVKTTARKELVLLHRSCNIENGLTKQWLHSRNYIMDHHHLQMDLLPITFIPRHNPSVLKHVKKRLQSYYKLISEDREMEAEKQATNNKDFARLARRLLGKSIGLVLGGGGARGLAHLGIIQALEEAGIPIDMVGGTSIGSFISGLYAREADHVSIYGRAKKFSHRMASKWRMALDLTYPITSWFTGHEFNRTLWKAFGERFIEDLWLPYFCVTTNITHSRMEIHRTGSLWRYVRASMSLSGFLPPLCDKGDMLLDGGYLNNLPADIMKTLGAEYIFAVDVASDGDTSPTNYGDSVNGWWLLLQRLLGRKINIPSLADIQSRLAYVSCVQKLEQIKSLQNVVYIKPPISHYATLEFGKFDDIAAVGYAHGKKMIKELEENGMLDELRFSCLQFKMKRSRRNSI